MSTNVLKSNLPYIGPDTENLISFIRDGLRKNADQTIVIDYESGAKWTGRQLEKAILRIVRYMHEEVGFKKGDVCSIYHEENDQVAILILAILCAGGTCIFLNQDYAGDEVSGTASLTKTKFLFSTAALIDKIQLSLDTMNHDITVLLVDKPCSYSKFSSRVIGELLKVTSSSSEFDFDKIMSLVQIDVEKDIGVIQFSSGTTGRPKIIPRTHKNLCHLVASVDHEELMALKPSDVLAGNLVMTHRPGLWALLACVKSGSTLVCGTKLVDVAEVFEKASKYRVTILSTSITFLFVMGTTGIKIRDQYDLSCLQQVITSGAKIVNPDQPRLIVDSFKLKSLRQCMGMTESGWVFLIESSLAKDNYLSVGHVVPGMEAMIINRETGAPLPANTSGEIALRGPQIFPGYLTTDKPGELIRSDFTEDGWFKIGDQAYYDDNELIYIMGRFKELMIFENSYRYFPNDIEAVISEHPAVAGVCVVNIGETTTNLAVYDVARAYITLKSGFKPTEVEITDFVHVKCPAITLEGGVRFIEQFPRLQNGKVDKTTLKNMP